MQPLLQLIDNTLPSMDEKFTTHELILKMAQENQRAYIEALYAYRDSSKPFQAVHSQIGKHLKKMTEKVQHIRDEKDADIFGNPGENALWKKQ